MGGLRTLRPVGHLVTSRHTRGRPYVETRAFVTRRRRRFRLLVVHCELTGRLRRLSWQRVRGIQGTTTRPAILVGVGPAE